MKYVMFEVRMGTLIKHVPVIFPNDLVHSMVAEALTTYRCKPFGDEEVGDLVIEGKVVGAGEVSVEVGKAHGFSSTLCIGPQEGDDSTINTIDYLHGLVEEEGPEEPPDGLVDVTGLEPELAADVQALADERQIAATEERFRSSVSIDPFSRLQSSLSKLRELVVLTNSPVMTNRQKKRRR